MRRIYLCLIALFVLFGQLSAAPISREQAQQKAAEFLAAKGLTFKEMKLARTASRKAAKAFVKPFANVIDSDNAAYYVFNTDAAGGFVIISGDDQTEAVLGYANRGAFDEATMPAHVKSWLDGYADQIEAIANDMAKPAKAQPKRAAIEPMIKTQWNQDAPYNTLCPTVDDQQCPTGCVATAMAQIMYYHKWPQEATTTIPAYTTREHEIYMKALPSTTFDWDAMPLYAKANESNQAVATLMLYVGQAFEMDYDPEGSGAWTSSALYGAQNYFGYDVNAKTKDRRQHTISEWHNLIYGELAEGRPVYYSGSASDAAHAFVCDGYDGNGLYHINWGWGGLFDGYFRLEVLNPQGGGIGSSTSDGGYSMYHDCIVGLQKPTGDTPIKENIYLTAMDFSVIDAVLSCGIFNSSNENSTFAIGWGIMDDDGQIARVAKIDKLKVALDAGYGYNDFSIDVSTLFLADGTYKIVPVSRETTTSVWKSALPANTYAEVVVKGKEITTKKYPTVDLEVSSYEWNELILPEVSSELRLTINNKGSEFNGIIYLCMTNAVNPIWKEVHDVEGAYIEAGESDIITLHPIFPTSGTYTVMIATDRDGANIIGSTTVNVLSGPENVDLELQNVKCERSGEEVVVTAIVKNNCTETYVGPIAMVEYGAEEGEEYASYLSAKEYNRSIEPGQTTTITHTMKNLKANVDYIVSIQAWDYSAKSYTQLGYSDWFMIEASDINGIVNDKADDDAPYYTLSGMKVDKPVKKGIYIRNGKKVVY